MIVYLPMPPSANHIWKSGKGRVYRSKEYTEWLKIAIGAFKAAGEQFSERVDVTLELCGKGRGDADNRFKAALDALKQSKVIVDDSKKYVRSVKAFWSDDNLDGNICVTVSPVEQNEPV
jgi:Holliday junction resolvase RusA-like endonuclease